MRNTLRALGKDTTTASGAWLAGSVISWTCVFLFAPEVPRLAGIRSPLTAHVLTWLCWLWWLGHLFPRHRDADVTRYGSCAFRRAFHRDVLQGVSCSFAQMLRPVLYGVAGGGLAVPVTAIQEAGLLVFVWGVVLIGLAMDALGIDGAIFLQEYVGPPRMVRTGIYGIVRHPLFFGGIIASVGAAIALGGALSLSMAAANLAVLLPYLLLEDRRCMQLFGHSYVGYRQTVGPFLPRWRGVLGLTQSAPASDRAWRV